MLRAVAKESRKMPGPPLQGGNTREKTLEGPRNRFKQVRRCVMRRESRSSIRCLRHVFSIQGSGCGAETVGLSLIEVMRKVVRS